MPWWPAFWEHNYFALAWPQLRPVLTNNFVRGAVSGLGFVNLVAGFADLALIFVSRAANDRTRGDFVDGRSPDPGERAVRDAAPRP
jgi:hypothetical protein